MKFKDMNAQLQQENLKNDLPCNIFIINQFIAFFGKKMIKTVYLFVFFRRRFYKVGIQQHETVKH